MSYSYLFIYIEIPIDKIVKIAKIITKFLKVQRNRPVLDYNRLHVCRKRKSQCLKLRIIGIDRKQKFNWCDRLQIHNIRIIFLSNRHDTELDAGCF